MEGMAKGTDYGHIITVNTVFVSAHGHKKCRRHSFSRLELCQQRRRGEEKKKYIEHDMTHDPIIQMQFLRFMPSLTLNYVLPMNKPWPDMLPFNGLFLWLCLFICDLRIELKSRVFCYFAVQNWRREEAQNSLFQSVVINEVLFF